MPVTPTIGRLTIPEAQEALAGLVAVNRLQLQQGARSVSRALHTGQLRYIRLDRREHWLNVREVWDRGGGDCEDLAAALAAELQLAGHPDARVILFQARPGLWHAVTEVTVGGRLVRYDPSRTGGMRAP